MAETVVDGHARAPQDHTRRPKGRRGPLARTAVAVVTSSAVTAAGMVGPAVIGPAVAEPPIAGLLDAEAVRAELTGRELAGIYPSGMHWREHVLADGTSQYVERGEKRIGRWWLSGPRFCFIYMRPGSGGCFRVSRSSANCYDLYFVARSGDPASRPGAGEQNESTPPARSDWNGIMWRTGEPSTCDIPSV